MHELKRLLSLVPETQLPLRFRTQFGRNRPECPRFPIRPLRFEAKPPIRPPGGSEELFVFTPNKPSFFGRRGNYYAGCKTKFPIFSLRPRFHKTKHQIAFAVSESKLQCFRFFPKSLEKLKRLLRTVSVAKCFCFQSFRLFSKRKLARLGLQNKSLYL